jgi:hypothetical protein
MSIFSDWIKRGTRGAQAAAALSNKGMLYWVTDESKLERSSGSVWESMSADGGMTRLQQIVTAASQATVDFTGIAATYSGLAIHWTARDTTAGTAANAIRVMFNNDATAGNYTAVAHAGTQNGAAINGTIASSVKGMFGGATPDDGNAAGMAGTGVIEVVGYANTTWHKRMMARSGYEGGGGVGLVTLSVTGRWISAAAINRVTIGTDAAAFKDGSVFTLYGIL